MNRRESMRNTIFKNTCILCVAPNVCGVVIGPYFVIRYLVKRSFLVLQSSRGEKESWLLHLFLCSCFHEVVSPFSVVSLVDLGSAILAFPGDRSYSHARIQIGDGGSGPPTPEKSHKYRVF